jgi:pimeloyl-ACP methyl ester carboxylesterase
MQRRPVTVLAASAVVALVAGCTPQSDPSDTVPPSASVRSASADATSSAGPGASAESPMDRFAVDDTGRMLAVQCEGQGSPTVVLEDGHPSETGGIARFSRGPLWARLTAETRACAYDRAGYANSDPAPNEPRDADDVITDLEALLSAAGEDGPFVLVGSSFGGMIVTYYASRHPEDVAGVVLLDVPAPTDTLTLEEIPELAWDHPANPEHVDVIPEFETRFARNPESMTAPLTVVTATNGQSDVDDQSFWLAISPEATQVELEGPHDIDTANPDGVLAQILSAVEAAR